MSRQVFEQIIMSHGMDELCMTLTTLEGQGTGVRAKYPWLSFTNTVVSWAWWPSICPVCLSPTPGLPPSGVACAWTSAKDRHCIRIPMPSESYNSSKVLGQRVRRLSWMVWEKRGQCCERSMDRPPALILKQDPTQFQIPSPSCQAEAHRCLWGAFRKQKK